MSTEKSDMKYFVYVISICVYHTMNIFIYHTRLKCQMMSISEAQIVLHADYKMIEYCRFCVYVIDKLIGK